MPNGQEVTANAFHTLSNAKSVNSSNSSNAYGSSVTDVASRYDASAVQAMRRRGRPAAILSSHSDELEPIARKRRDHVSRVNIRGVNILEPPPLPSPEGKPKRKRGRNWKRYKGLGKGNTIDGTRKRHGYSRDTLVEAVEAVQSGMNMYQAYRQYGVPVSTIFSHIHGLRNGPIGSHQHLRADEQAALDDAHVAARRSIENGAPLVRLRIRATLTGTQTRAAYEHGAVMRRDGESMRRCLEELITIEQRSAPFCDTELAVERVAHRADLETLVAGFAASAFEKRSMVRCFSSAQAERVVAAYCARTQQQFELVSSEAVKPGLYDRIPARSNLFNRDRPLQFQSDSRKRFRVMFDGIPWLYLGERQSVCSECLRLMAAESDAPSTIVIHRKCPSRISIVNVLRFPQYKLQHDSYKGRVCCASVVTRDWDSDIEVIVQPVYYVFLPTVHQHLHQVTLSTTVSASDTQTYKFEPEEPLQDTWSVEVEPMMSESRSRVPLLVEFDDDEQKSVARDDVAEGELITSAYDWSENEHMTWPIRKHDPDQPCKLPAADNANRNENAEEDLNATAGDARNDSQPVEVVVEVMTSGD